MNYSDEEFTALVEAAADFSDYRSGEYFTKAGSPDGTALRLRDPALLPPWAIGLRRMLSALAAFELDPGNRSSLVLLCETGARYGLNTLEATTTPALLALISKKAKRSLKLDLQRVLQRVTRRCLELERTSHASAVAAIGLHNEQSDPKSMERKFLGGIPGDRLFALFRQFPVLPRLWFELIHQWRDQAGEFLSRLIADRTALSHTYFDDEPLGLLVALTCGLSDPHHHGRTVMLLKFLPGSVIYKPRSGDGEWEWGSLLEWMNIQSFRPKLRAARVLRREGYCWMERIEPSRCGDSATARRFHKRLGGLIAAAYLLKAVDCHRDNLIVSDDDPVLIDADALWHPSPDGKTETAFDLLYRSGFFPNSNRGSLPSRSSVLSHRTAEPHQREIVDGFGRAWRCVLGTRDRGVAFARRLRRIVSRKRRLIYWPTERYAQIARASIQPTALRSGIERELLIARLCSRKGVPSVVLQAEIDALKGLDIPYFSRGGKEHVALHWGNMPADVHEALLRLLSGGRRS